MSAYVVGTDHIDGLLTVALQHRGNHSGPLRWHTADGAQQLDDNTADRVGGMLLAENVASVSARYPNDNPRELPGPVPTPDPAAYQFRTVHDARITPVNVLSMLACYEYQSCEHDGWEASEAHAFCQALRKDLIRRLPGYEDAPWEYERPEGSPKPAGRVHTINCAEAEARSKAGEQLVLTPGQCWCGSAMPERKAPKARKRKLTLVP